MTEHDKTLLDFIKSQGGQFIYVDREGNVASGTVQAEMNKLQKMRELAARFEQLLQKEDEREDPDIYEGELLSATDRLSKRIDALKASMELADFKSQKEIRAEARRLEGLSITVDCVQDRLLKLEMMHGKDDGK